MPKSGSASGGKILSKKSKSAPKKVYKKGPTKSQVVNAKRSKTLSFVVGVITVAIIAFVIFQYSQSNNYKTVLGAHTETSQESTK
ncbi:MAG TPA: hypothetical protein VG917_01890 [Patescibacteria group bacterium]|nr:hypothetical protein [Patescibacteria group bacterium]